MATTYEKDGIYLAESTVKTVTVTEGAKYTLAEIDKAIAGIDAEIAFAEERKAVWVARKAKAEELEVEEQLEAEVPQTPLPVDAEPQPV